MMDDIEIYTSGLSALGCLWIIFKYFQQPKDNIGLLLIFVLAVSDLIFSFNLIIEHLFEPSVVNDIIFFFTMQFSVLWAAAVSFIVYRSLQNSTLRVMNLFRMALGIVILISTLIVIFLSYTWASWLYLFDMLPLIISLILTFVFYSMSINILKQQAEYSSISTNIYVRTLRSYSLVQFLTYGPLIIFLMLNIFDKNLIPLSKLIVYLWILRMIASLSGLFNALIFIVQGTGNLKSFTNSTDKNIDADLTLDTPMFHPTQIDRF